MFKRLLIILVVIIALLAVAFMYLNNRNRTLSPPGEASITNRDLTVSLTYSRPSVRERVIFGTEEQDALQPYGVYWRLGANESTEITFSKDVRIMGLLVSNGTYRMYAFPGPDSFELRLNTELDQWGYFEPDESLDVISVKVPTLRIDPVEQFTISMAKVDTAEAVNVIFEWSDVRFELPVVSQ